MGLSHCLGPRLRFTYPLSFSFALPLSPLVSFLESLVLPLSCLFELMSRPSPVITSLGKDPIVALDNVVWRGEAANSIMQ